MSDLELKLKSLVVVREILRRRGTDVGELEREIERLTGLKRGADLPTAA